MHNYTMYMNKLMPIKSTTKEGGFISSLLSEVVVSFLGISSLLSEVVVSFLGHKTASQREKYKQKKLCHYFFPVISLASHHIECHSTHNLSVFGCFNG